MQSNVIKRGFRDIRIGFASSSIYIMLAMNDVSRRYKRSKLGQIWITLSMGAMIIGVGLVFSQIFSMPLETFLPFLAVSLVLWGFVQNTLNESCNTFMENEGFVRQLSLPRFTYVLRTVFRNLIVSAHNVAIIPLVFLFYFYPVGAENLLFIPGLILVLANLLWMGYVLAILSARFRDVPQIVASVLQVAFFLTPVMYKPVQLGPDHPLLLLNPLASLLAVIRDPLVGQVPSVAAYGISATMLIVGGVFSVYFAGRYSHRVVYWL